MEIIIEPKITKDLIQKIFCLYDENFSPIVKVSHKKLRKRLNEGVYKAIIVKNFSYNKNRNINSYIRDEIN